jgi:hypothetical protein
MPCDNKMGKMFWEVVCDEYGIGGSGEDCGDNNAQLDRISVFYDEVARTCPARRSSTLSPALSVL